MIVAEERCSTRFDGMCRLPYDENQSLVISRRSFGSERIKFGGTGQFGFLRLTTTAEANDQGPSTGLMRIAYLDCFSGMSGDMFLGALVDAGVPRQLLEETVAALNIGARLEISRVQRNGISATKVDVYSNGEKDLPREMWEQQAGQSGHARSRTCSSTLSMLTMNMDTMSMAIRTLITGNRLRC